MIYSMNLMTRDALCISPTYTNIGYEYTDIGMGTQRFAVSRVYRVYHIRNCEITM